MADEQKRQERILRLCEELARLDVPEHAIDPIRDYALKLWKPDHE